MNGPPPRVAAASQYRRLLADEIAGTVKAGKSVALIGGSDTDDLLGLAAVALAGIRVLALRPPWDSASFISQFATEWRASSKDADLATGPVMLPEASGERFAMLLHQAHLIPTETFRHLERLAQAWPGMQMVFAGPPGLAETVRAAEHPTLASRLATVIEVSAADEMRRLQQPGEAHKLSDASPAQPAPTITAPAIMSIKDNYPPLKMPPRAAAVPDQHVGSASQIGSASSPHPRQGLGRVTTGCLAALVAIVVMTTTAVPRLPRNGLSPAPEIQVAVTAPGPASAPGQAPAEVSPTAGPEPQPNRAMPITGTAEQPAAPEPTAETPALVVTAPPAAPAPPAIPAPAAPHPVALPPVASLPAVDPVQETAPPAAPASTPAAAPPEPAHHIEAEDNPGFPLRPPSNSSAPSPSPAMADAMTRRGQAMLEIGDVSAARLLLARAASAGSGPAALAMGTTYEAATLERIGAVGILPDPAVAAAWYRFALGLGEERAQAMLDSLPVDVVTTKPKDTP